MQKVFALLPTFLSQVLAELKFEGNNDSRNCGFFERSIVNKPRAELHICLRIPVHLSFSFGSIPFIYMDYTHPRAIPQLDVRAQDIQVSRSSEIVDIRELSCLSPMGVSVHPPEWHSTMQRVQSPYTVQLNMPQCPHDFTSTQGNMEYAVERANSHITWWWSIESKQLFQTSLSTCRKFCFSSKLKISNLSFGLHRKPWIKEKMQRNSISIMTRFLFISFKFG